MRGGVQGKSRIIETGERSVRSFFEHSMSTYAAALAYRGLFELSPFLFILVVHVAALGFSHSLDQAVEHAHSEASKNVPQQLQPVVHQGKKQIQPLQGIIDNAHKQAGGDLLFFGVGVALWSVSEVARTLTKAFNVAYKVTETRRLWKRLALSLSFGPFLALMAIVSVVLMLVGTQLVERIAKVVGFGDYGRCVRSLQLGGKQPTLRSLSCSRALGNS